MGILALQQAVLLQLEDPQQGAQADHRALVTTLQEHVRRVSAHDGVDGGVDAGHRQGRARGRGARPCAAGTAQGHEVEQMAARTQDKI